MVQAYRAEERVSIFKVCVFQLPVNFIEWSSVREAAFPDLVHYLHGL